MYVIESHAEAYQRQLREAREQEEREDREERQRDASTKEVRTTMGGTSDASELKTAAVPAKPELPPIPNYGRETADRIIAKVKVAAEAGSALAATFSPMDLRILNDMLYEMDKHLPDFFEAESKPEAS